MLFVKIKIFNRLILFKLVGVKYTTNSNNIQNKIFKIRLNFSSDLSKTRKYTKLTLKTSFLSLFCLHMQHINITAIDPVSGKIG